MSRTSSLLIVLVAILLGTLWFSAESGGPEPRLEGGWSLVHSSDDVGLVAGRLLLDEDVPPDQIELVLEVTLLGDSQATLAHLPVDVGLDGVFVSVGLPASNASVSIRVAGTELLRLEDVEVPDRGPSTDERLEEIDLRDRVHVFALELYDVEGRPLERATIGWRESVDTDEEPVPYQRSVIALDGRATVVSPYAWIDVLVAGPGLRAHEVHGLSLGRELHLREGWLVRLALPEGVDPAADGVRLLAHLERVDDDRRLHPSEERLRRAMGRVRDVTFTGSEAEVRLPELGTWELTWEALVRSDVGLRQLSLGRERPLIEVSGGSFREAIRPRFPLEAYRAGLVGR